MQTQYITYCQLCYKYTELTLTPFSKSGDMFVRFVKGYEYGLKSISVYEFPSFQLERETRLQYKD